MYADVIIIDIQVSRTWKSREIKNSGKDSYSKRVLKIKID